MISFCACSNGPVNKPEAVLLVRDTVYLKSKEDPTKTSPSATLTADKMNFVYLGGENPMSLNYYVIVPTVLKIFPTFPPL